MFGTRVARVAGIAPRARVAVYKACWIKPGETRATCATSDLARAVDDAVADGVDIINYSLGSLETDLSAPDDLALLNAFDAGVLTVVAAGNDGPDLDTIGSPSSAPWVMTVARRRRAARCSTRRSASPSPTDIAGELLMREASFTPKLTSDDPIEEALVEADDGQATRSNGSTGSTRDACESLVNGDDIDGHIALIERGGCEFELKIMHAEEAGAVGVVVYNTSGDPIVMNGDAGSVDIPAVMIGAADGELLLDALGRRRRGARRAREGHFRLAAGVRQPDGGLLVARPRAQRPQLPEARRHGARRRHPRGHDARRPRTACRARRSDTSPARRRPRPRSRASRYC